jgi:nucleotide-binding universal stress UspA family protein
MIRIKKILVATDFGEASDTALKYGRELARLFEARLHVIHITENVDLTIASGYGFSSVPAGVQQEIERAAQQQTDALLTDEDRQALGAVAVTYTHTSPAAAIVDYARTHNIDMILLGTHGRGPLGHFFMGSVAERVVRMAPCPVMTMRHPQHEFLKEDALVATSHG